MRFRPLRYYSTARPVRPSGTPGCYDRHDVDDAVSILRTPLGSLPDPLPIPVVPRRIGRAQTDASIRPPGSKSLTNRALLLAALAEGESELGHPLLAADDAERMLAALRQLGATVEHGDGATLRVRGVGGRWRVPPEGVTLFLNNAGTATRFLSAAALLATGPVTIDGNERMRQRPIGELVAALRELGATVEELGEPGCPPLKITPPAGNKPAVSEIVFEPTQSSQFISAVLLAAPFFPGGLTVRLVGTITSSAYVRMTVDLLDRLGAAVRTTEDLRLIRVNEGMHGFRYSVEPDASGATYFWAAAALLPGSIVRVEGLGEASFQGDADFPEMLERMGAQASIIEGDGQGTPGAIGAVAVEGPDRLGPLLCDMADMPDAAVTLAVCCAFARGPSIIRGVRTLRVKETDRIAALQTELAKVGVSVEADVHGDPDVMTITPPEDGIDCSSNAPPVAFDTYDDHRMAMALSLIGLRRPGVVINDPGCVAKTYPGFFADLAKLYPSG